MSKRIGLRHMQSIGGKKPPRYIYVGHYEATGATNRIARVDVQTFTLKDYLNIPLATDYYMYALAKDDNFLYVTDEGGHVTKVNLSSWSIEDTLTLPAEECYIRDAIIVDGYLYLAIYASPSKVVKVNLTNFQREGSITLATGENNAAGLASDGQCLYVDCGTSPTKIVKINLATFSEVATLTLGSGENYSARITVDNGKLYVPCGYPDARLVKVDLSTFTREAGLLLEAGIGQASAASSVKDNYIYVSPAAAQKVYKVHVPTFSLVGSINTFVRSNNKLLIDGDYLYCQNSNYADAGRIEKIDLLTFTSLGTCITWASEYTLTLCFA